MRAFGIGAWMDLLYVIEGFGTEDCLGIMESQLRMKPSLPLGDEYEVEILRRGIRPISTTAIKLD